MKPQSARFHQRLDPHPARLKVAAQRTRCRGRPIAVCLDALPRVGYQSRQAPGTVGGVRQQVSRSSSLRGSASCHVGCIGRCHWARIRKCTARRSWDGQCMEWQIRKKGSTDRICRDYSQAGATVRCRRVNPCQSRSQALLHLVLCSSRPDVVPKVGENRHSEICPKRPSSYGLQTREDRGALHLALEATPHAYGLSRESRSYAGDLRCRRAESR